MPISKKHCLCVCVLNEDKSGWNFSTETDRKEVLNSKEGK